MEVRKQPRQRSGRQRRVDQAAKNQAAQRPSLPRRMDANDASAPYQAEFQTPGGTVELGPVAHGDPPEAVLESIAVQLSLDQTPTGGWLALIDPDTEAVVARRRVRPRHDLRSIEGGKQHDGQ